MTQIMWTVHRATGHKVILCLLNLLGGSTYLCKATVRKQQANNKRYQEKEAGHKLPVFHCG